MKDIASAKVVNKLKKQENGSDWFQIFAIISACLSAITSGILFSWSSPSIPRIVADKINYNITLDEASYFTVLPPIGAIVSSLIFSRLNDVIGRKTTLLLIAVPHITSLLLVGFAKSVWQFYAARFILGFGDSCLFASLPMYVGEIASPKVRGSWGNLMTFSIYVGQFFINLIGSYLSISTTAFVCLIFPSLFLVTFSLFPESPYYYLMKNREEDARKSLIKLRRTENIEEEFMNLKQDVQRQMSETGTWKDLFTIKSNQKALLSGVFLRASQQVGGVSSFAVYTQYIFSKSGSNFSASTSAMIYTGLLSVLNLVASFTLDKFGRKKSYFYSLLFAGIVLLVEAIYFYLESVGIVMDERVNWIPLGGMITWVFFYSFGLGIVPTLMLGELFSTSVKGKGLCVLNIVFGLLVSSSTKLFQVLSTQIGMFAPFLFFSVSCFISTFLARFLVPETKGKTLEEIQQELKGTKKDKRDNC